MTFRRVTAIAIPRDAHIRVIVESCSVRDDCRLSVALVARTANSGGGGLMSRIFSHLRNERNFFAPVGILMCSNFIRNHEGEIVHFYVQRKLSNRFDGYARREVFRIFPS